MKSMGALAELLSDAKSQLDADAEVDARLAEVADLRAKLAVTYGTVSTAKAAPVADTRDIDLLDGKLYVAMRDLNEAGRRAIRNGALNASLSEYRFVHLNRSGRPGAPAQSAAASAETSAT